MNNNIINKLFKNGKIKVSLLSLDDIKKEKKGSESNLGILKRDVRYDRSSAYWLKTCMRNYEYAAVNYDEEIISIDCKKSVGIRPTLENIDISYVIANSYDGRIFEFGEYFVGRSYRETKFMKKTGKEYLLMNTKVGVEYEDSSNGKKYVSLNQETAYLSEFYEVKPIIWIIDRENKRLISKYVIDIGYITDRIPPLTSKIRFKGSEMDEYLNGNFIKNILPSNTNIHENNLTDNNNEEDEDIQKLLIEIMNMCSELPDDLRSNISDKIKKIKREYEQEKSGQQKKVSFIESSSISMDLIGDPRINYLQKLIILKNSLYKEEYFVKQIKKIESYKKIVDTDIKKAPANDDSIEYYIKNILFLSLSLKENLRRQIKYNLEDILENTVKKLHKKVKNILEEKVLLTLEDKEEVIKSLKSELIDLQERICTHNKNQDSLKPLSDCLKSKDILLVNDSNPLINLVNNTRYLISLVPVIEKREELEEELSCLYKNHWNSINDACFLMDNESYNRFNSRLEEYIQNIHRKIEDSLNVSINDAIKINEQYYLKQLLSVDVDSETEPQLQPLELPLGYAKVYAFIELFNELITKINESTIKEDDKKRLFGEICELIKSWQLAIDEEDNLIDEIIRKICGCINELNYSQNNRVLKL